jgi:hypothetical protein
MMHEVEWFEEGKKRVASLSGQPEEHSLCQLCAKHPTNMDNIPCVMATVLEGVSKGFGMTTTVWECDKFETEKDELHHSS